MRIFLWLLFCISILSCASNKKSTKKDKSIPDKETLEFEENDEGEYDIIVFDVGYETFLQTHAFPKEYFSKSYYQGRNRFLVTEWNIRASNPLKYGDLYESFINYNPNIDYGLNFEYKLFNFFMFVEWKYNVNLDGRPPQYR